MNGFTEQTATDILLKSLSNCGDERLKAIIVSVIRHLHEVVKEIELTQDEWMAAIQFLTATGQMCDDRRQEWILLSDILGVSMLVDAINNRKPADATPSTVLGPFHVAGAPELPPGPVEYTPPLPMGDAPCRDASARACSSSPWGSRAGVSIS